MITKPFIWNYFIKNHLKFKDEVMAYSMNYTDLVLLHTMHLIILQEFWPVPITACLFSFSFFLLLIDYQIKQRPEKGRRMQWLKVNYLGYFFDRSKSLHYDSNESKWGLLKSYIKTWDVIKFGSLIAKWESVGERERER